MKNECIDKTIGSKLHAYELDLLSDVETEQIEIHLMSCEFCLTQVNNFADESLLLHTDKDIKAELKLLDKSRNNSKATVLNAFHYFSQKKPAIVLAAACILLFFYFGLDQFNHSDISTYQQLKLFPHRSTNQNVAQLNGDEIVEIIFGFEGSNENSCYVLTIKDDSDSVIFENKSFCDFDNANLGKIIIPQNLFKNGRYQMKIIDPNGDLLNNTQEYRFTIISH